MKGKKKFGGNEKRKMDRTDQRIYQKKKSKKESQKRNGEMTWQKEENSEKQMGSPSVGGRVVSHSGHL